MYGFLSQFLRPELLDEYSNFNVVFFGILAHILLSKAGR